MIGVRLVCVGFIALKGKVKRRKKKRKKGSVRVDWRSLTDGQEITWREREERGGGGERERGVKKLKKTDFFSRSAELFSVGKRGDTLCCV